MPVLFIAHGSPLLLEDAAWRAELADWARALPRPRALLVFSAHWTEAPLTLGATRTVPLVYDFYGFPERMYRTRYSAPGAPALAERVAGLAAAAGVGPTARADRGLDHGAFVPLVAMYPEADVPVLQVSLPSLEPAPLLALGRAIAPLRDEGMLICASGFLTHNLGAAVLHGAEGPPPPWARAFDAWTADVLARGDLDALADYRRAAPGVRESLPTHEHFAPLFVGAGAAAGDPARFPITGWAYGSMTKRSVQWG